MSTTPECPWLLLIISLPTPSATARMRVWRALKAQGCVALRDGAYLLPNTPQHEAALCDLAQECLSEGGSAWLMATAPSAPEDRDSFPALFDRTQDYAALVQSWQQAARTLGQLAPAELARLQKKMRREFDAVRAIDFFPGPAAEDTQAAWAAVDGRIGRLLSPDEPHPEAGTIPALERSAYQGRLWATRKRLWVDRVSSAWLVRRFIDPDARFCWLDDPADCPRDALGFDFDGASFTHVGDRVTFEVLLASFGLEADGALARIAALVHVLDVGGDPVPEAAGFEAVLAGARARAPDDDALLDDMGQVLDALYLHFQREAGRTRAKPGRDPAAPASAPAAPASARAPRQAGARK